MTSSDVKFGLHPEYAAAQQEIAKLRAQLAALPGVAARAREEAEALTAQAVDLVLDDWKAADKTMTAAAAAQARADLLARRRRAMESRLAELERQIQGQLRWLNQDYVAGQAEPHRRETLQAFVALRPQIEALLGRARAVEAAVAEAHGTPDYHWIGHLERALEAIRAAEERAGGR